MTEVAGQPAPVVGPVPSADDLPVTGDGPSWAEEVAATRAAWTRLGLPGLIDIHTHFLPAPVERKVWAQFDAAGPKIGRPWPIRYRGTPAERVAQLRALGVRRFPTLPYAHRPGIAGYLNDWAAAFACEVPESLWSGTFFPEADAASYVAEGVGAGVEIWKVHVQVGEFDLDDPLLDPVWGVLAEAGSPVVVHAGHAPVGNAHTGVGPVRRVLARHPRLALVAAHCGAPDYLEFLDLAAGHERVHVDTTMVFTDFWDTTYPDGLLGRLADLGDRVLLGTDFPAIPYVYLHQVEALERLGLGDEWVRRVCWDNAVALVGGPERGVDGREQPGGRRG